MFYNCSKNNNEIWQNLIKYNETPSYFTELINVEFNDFKKNISEQNYAYQENLINKLFSGAIIQLTNSLNNELISTIINSSKELSKSNLQSKTICKEGTKNYFYKQSNDMSLTGGYKALDKSYYFFPWDSTSTNIFSEIFDYWRFIKILSGLDFDTYEKNTPKDGIINRMHIIQYLKGGGTISPHKDPFDSVKIQVGCVLNTYGEDYHSGGFSVFRNKNEKRLLEPDIIKGSLYCFFPTLYHTVDPIDPNEKIDFNSDKGRWFMSLTCVGSDHQKNRQKTISFKS